MTARINKASCYSSSFNDTLTKHTHSTVSSLKDPILTCSRFCEKEKKRKKEKKKTPRLGQTGACELGVSRRADGAVSHTQLRTSIAHVRGVGSYRAKATSVRGLRVSITLYLPVWVLFSCRRMA